MGFVSMDLGYLSSEGMEPIFRQGKKKGSSEWVFWGKNLENGALDKRT